MEDFDTLMPTTKFKEINGKEYIGEIDYGIEVNDKKFFRLNLIYPKVFKED